MVKGVTQKELQQEVKNMKAKKEKLLKDQAASSETRIEWKDMTIWQKMKRSSFGGTWRAFFIRTAISLLMYFFLYVAALSYVILFSRILLTFDLKLTFPNYFALRSIQS